MQLTEAGQIKQGDTIHCEYKGKKQQYVAEDILGAGTKHEEVIINTLQNKYFITEMAIKGTSWAKNVEVLPAN